MVNFDYTYFQGLEYYLQHSEEDEVNSETFLKNFQLHGKLGKNSILHWMDVGAGPATKPLMILKGTKKHTGLLDLINVSLDIIEPSEDWIKILSQNFQQEGLKWIIRRVYPLKWEEFQDGEQYDLITFFHSVYGIQTDSLSQIPKFLKEKGCACIVVESPNSDFHKIKEKVFPYIHKKELLFSSETISSFFQNKDIKYEVSNEEPEQKFYVDGLLENPEKISIISSFIAGVAPEDYIKAVTREMRDLIEKELRTLVKKDKDGQAYINVPDRFIWIYKK